MNAAEKSRLVNRKAPKDPPRVGIEVRQLRQLVGNPAAYALQQEDGSWKPVRKPLGDSVLRAHVGLLKTVGTYVGHKVGSETIARTLVFDIDEMDKDKTIRRAIHAALKEFGVPLSARSTEFSGSKGWHVWVVLDDYVPARDLRRLGRAVLAVAGVTCEVFPKQDEVRDLGNLVKLPGGVHQVSRRLYDFTKKVPRPMPVEDFEAILAELPEEQHARRAVSDTRFPCMEAIQADGAEEGSRNIQLFHLSTMLRRAGVDDEYTSLVIDDVNKKCSPPLDGGELEMLLESSKTSGPLCHLLPEDRQCGELCIRERTAGLYTRPGQLRHAAEGENVVVTMGERTDEVVSLLHDDLKNAKGRLRTKRGRE
jgi:hypothetical protein